MSGKLFSLHDFDLGSQMKLMKKVGRIKDMKIICVPMEMEEEKALQKVADAIRNITGETKVY